jgi:ribonuclease-3
MNSPSSSERSLPQIEEHHRPLLEAMQQTLGYRFKTGELLLKALIHPSMRDLTKFSYERLEFLGDAVLGLVVAEHLFQKYPGFDEGELTRIKSTVVSRTALARLGRKLSVADQLVLGKGMRSATLPRSVLANATEALLGALYLDGGLEETRRFILEHLSDLIVHAEEPRRSRNHKSMLQHLTQRQGRGTPTYRILSVSGPDHSRTFEVCALIGERSFPAASGPSKKIAEQRAARNALRVLAEADEQDLDSTS